jgi:acyl-CoA synthetase (NDP forming)
MAKPKPTVLDLFFRPKSIAVAGASRSTHKIGRIIYDNLSRSFKGPVYPLNPQAEIIGGQKSYASVGMIPETPDLLIIATPAQTVPDIVKEAAKEGVRAAIIISAGFSEVGRKSLEEEVVKAKGKMRLLGPNVMGVFDAHSNFDIIFNPKHRQSRPQKGKIAFISQSGALGAAVMDWAAMEGVGISKFISIGNRADVDEVELLHGLEHDPQTNAIAVYLEGTHRGRELYNKLRETAKRKPVVAIKAGRTEAGAKAVMSHTASLAGEVEVWRGMFDQAGAIEAKEIDDLFDIAKALSEQPLPKITADSKSGAISTGNRIQIITNGGGFGVMCADEILEQDLRLAQLSQKTVKAIRSFREIPPHATVGNPIDLTGDSTAQMYQAAISAVLSDPGVDAAIIVVLFQIPTLEAQIVSILKEASQRFGKPILVCTTGGEFTQVHRRLIEKAGIPTYPTPFRAVRAMQALVRYAQVKKRK